MLLTSLLEVCGLISLPVLEVPDILQRGLLPGGGTRVVVHVVDTSSLVLSALPAVQGVKGVNVLVSKCKRGEGVKEGRDGAV